MAKVIVPKNCVYNHNFTVSGITTSNIIGSTYTTNLGVVSDNINSDGVLGLNVTIDYKMSNSTVNVPWTDFTLKYITIKNSLSFGCNFIILTVNNLPKIKNTGSVLGPVTIRLGLNDGTYINLYSPGASPGNTITIPNQTYYVDLVNKTATTNVNNLVYNYNKAIIYNDSYWRAPQETYTNTAVSTSYTITPNNPFPYIFNDIEFRGPAYSGSGNYRMSINSSTDIIVNINTTNNPSYIFLSIYDLPIFENTALVPIQLRLYVNISGVKILIDSIIINSGFAGTLGLGIQKMCIDVINKELIFIGDTNTILQKAITHL